MCIRNIQTVSLDTIRICGLRVVRKKNECITFDEKSPSMDGIFYIFSITLSNVLKNLDVTYASNILKEYQVL